jgi:hypothetical protein
MKYKHRTASSDGFNFKKSENTKRGINPRFNQHFIRQAN